MDTLTKKWLLKWDIGFEENQRVFVGLREEAQAEAYSLWVESGNLNALYDFEELL